MAARFRSLPTTYFLLNQSEDRRGALFNPQVPGNLTVNVSGTLRVAGDARIETVARGPALAAADMNITAHDISITGGGFLSTESKSSGPGGRLNIFAENLELTAGGQIRSGSTLGLDPLTGTAVIPSGAGGTITIQGLASPAASVVIDGAGSGIITDTVGTGAGGNTNVSAQSVTIQNGGIISASTSGIAPSATGGSITISTGQLALNTGGSISAGSSGPGNAGTVTVQGVASPATLVLINGAGSEIHTDTTGTGAGGNII